MDTNTTIIIVTIILAVVIIIGFLIFRRKAKVDLELHGNKLKFEGENPNTKSKESTPAKKSNGIFANWSIGKTKIKVTGSGAIADNKNIGDTELTKEDSPSLIKKKK